MAYFFGYIYTPLVPLLPYFSTPPSPKKKKTDAVGRRGSRAGRSGGVGLEALVDLHVLLVTGVARGGEEAVLAAGEDQLALRGRLPRVGVPAHAGGVVGLAVAATVGARERRGSRGGLVFGLVLDHGLGRVGRLGLGGGFGVCLLGGLARRGSCLALCDLVGRRSHLGDDLGLCDLSELFARLCVAIGVPLADQDASSEEDQHRHQPDPGALVPALVVGVGARPCGLQGLVACGSFAHLGLHSCCQEVVVGRLEDQAPRSVFRWRDGDGGLRRTFVLPRPGSRSFAHDLTLGGGGLSVEVDAHTLDGGPKVFEPHIDAVLVPIALGDDDGHLEGLTGLLRRQVHRIGEGVGTPLVRSRVRLGIAERSSARHLDLRGRAVCRLFCAHIHLYN